MVRRDVIVGLVCVWGLVACDEPPSADPCAERLTELERRLEAQLALRDPRTAPPDVPLPRIEGDTPLLATPLLVIGADEVRFDGRGAGGLTGDASRLEATTGALLQDLRSHLEMQGGEHPVEVGLWVDPAVTLQTLHALLAHAHPRLRFVPLARGPIAPTEGPSWLEDELTRVEPPAEGEGEGFPAVSVVTPRVQRRARLPAAWIRATEGCEAARAALQLDPQGTLTRASLPTLVGSLGECGCEGPDLGAIEAVAREVLRSDGGPLIRTAAVVRFGPGGGTEIELPGDTSYERLARRLGRRPPGLVSIRVE